MRNIFKTIWRFFNTLNEYERNQFNINYDKDTLKKFNNIKIENEINKLLKQRNEYIEKYKDTLLEPYKIKIQQIQKQIIKVGENYEI